MRTANDPAGVEELRAAVEKLGPMTYAQACAQIRGGAVLRRHFPTMSVARVYAIATELAVSGIHPFAITHGGIDDSPKNRGTK